MSTRAVAYITALVVCPNGEHLTRTEKLAGLVLADSHQDRAHRRTYPAVEGMAEDSMMSERHFIRMLGSLERKGVIRREYPDGHGRGKTTFYFFPELDEKGCQVVTLSAVQNTSAPKVEKAVKDDKRVTNGASPILSNKYNKSKSNYPLTPVNGGMISESLKPQVESVMQACGFVELWRRGDKPGRLRRILAEVIQAESNKGESAQSTALALIAAWKDYVFADTLVTVRYGPAKFFQLGIWRDQRSWNWDVAAVERQRNARVGT